MNEDLPLKEQYYDSELLPKDKIENLKNQLKMYFYNRTFGPKILDDVKSLLSTYSNYVNIKTDTFEFILHIYEIFLDSKVCKTFEEAKYNNLMNSPLKNIYICREKAITEYKSFLKNKLNYYDRDGFLACVASKGMGKTRFIHECQKMTYEDEQFNDFIVVVTSFNASSGYMDIETDFNNEWSLNSLNLRIVWNLITKNNNNFQKFARIWLLCFTEWETDDLLDKILKYYKKSKMAIMIDELTQMKPSKIENYANKFFKWIKQKLLYKDSPFYVCVTSLTELGAIQLKEMKTSSDRPFKLAVLNPLETSNIEIINLFNKIDFIKDKKLNIEKLLLLTSGHPRLIERIFIQCSEIKKDDWKDEKDINNSAIKVFEDCVKEMFDTPHEIDYFVSMIELSLTRNKISIDGEDSETKKYKLMFEKSFILGSIDESFEFHPIICHGLLFKAANYVREKFHHIPKLNNLCKAYINFFDSLIDLRPDFRQFECLLSKYLILNLSLEKYNEKTQVLLLSGDRKSNSIFFSKGKIENIIIDIEKITYFFYTKFDNYDWYLTTNNLHYGEVIEGTHNNNAFDFLLPLNSLAIGFECKQSINDGTAFKYSDCKDKQEKLNCYSHNKVYKFGNLKYTKENVILCFLSNKIFKEEEKQNQYYIVDYDCLNLSFSQNYNQMLKFTFIERLKNDS